MRSVSRASKRSDFIFALDLKGFRVNFAPLNDRSHSDDEIGMAAWSRAKRTRSGCFCSTNCHSVSSKAFRGAEETYSVNSSIFWLDVAVYEALMYGLAMNHRCHCCRCRCPVRLAVIAQISILSSNLGRDDSDSAFLNGVSLNPLGVPASRDHYSIGAQTIQI